MDKVDIPRESVMHIQSEMRCAACWEPVYVLFEDKGLVTIHCLTEGCNCPGLVSLKYVELRLSYSLAESIEAKIVLGGAVEWMKALAPPKHTEAENLKALGY